MRKNLFMLAMLLFAGIAVNAQVARVAGKTERKTGNEVQKEMPGSYTNLVSPAKGKVSVTLYLTTSGGSFGTEKWVSVTTEANGAGTVVWAQGTGTYGNGAGFLADAAITVEKGTTYYLNCYDKYADSWDGTTYVLRTAAAGEGEIVINNGNVSPSDETDTDPSSSFDAENMLSELESSEAFMIAAVQFDAALTYVSLPDYLAGVYDVSVTLKNIGTDALTACDIDYDIDGTTGTFVWAGNLATNEEDTIVIYEDFDFASEGEITASATVVLTDDANAANNTASATSTIYLAFELPFSEMFDADIPQFWKAEIGTGAYNWTYATSGTYPTCSPYSAPGMLEYNCYSASAGSTAFLYTPAFSLSNVDAAKATFAMYRDAGFSSDADKIEVYVNTAKSETGAELIGTVNRNKTMSPVEEAEGWYEYTYDIPTTYTSSENYLIFKGTSEYGNNIFIDNVSIFEPVPVDIAVTQISPATGYVGYTYIPVVTIENLGSLDQAVWTVTLTDGAGYTETISDENTITASSSYEVVFPEYTLVEGQNALTASVTIADDANIENNEITVEVEGKTPYTTPFFDDFETGTVGLTPVDWSVETNAVAWRTDSNVGAYEGVNSLVTYYNSTLAKNDWAFTPAIILESSKTYKISFMVNAPGYGGTPEHLGLYAGTDANSIDMTDLLWESDLETEGYSQVIANFTPSTDGIYMFGLWASTIVDINYISVDNFGVSEAYNHNMKANGISGIYPLVGENTTMIPSVSITNDGTNDETTYTVTLTINDGTSDVYTETVSDFAPISANASELVPFPSFNFVSGTYTLSAEIVCADDEFASDNTTEVTVVTYVPATVREDFEGDTFLPVAWYETSNQASWIQTQSDWWYTLDNKSAAIAQDTNSDTVMLFSPKTAVNASVKNVNFDVFQGNGNLGSGSSFLQLYYSSDLNNTWTAIGNLMTLDMTEPVSVSVDITAMPEGAYYFAFETSSDFNNADYMSIAVLDNIVIDVLPEVSVSNISNSQISVYPNPSNGVFTVNTTEAMNLQVTDITGKILNEMNVNGIVTLNIEEAGMYFLRFANENGTSVQRVIVK